MTLFSTAGAKMFGVWRSVHKMEAKSTLMPGYLSKRKDDELPDD